MGNFDMVPFRVTTGWINVNVVSVINIAKRELVSTIGMDYYDLGVGNPWDICYSADGRHVCVSLSGVPIAWPRNSRGDGTASEAGR